MKPKAPTLLRGKNNKGKLVKKEISSDEVDTALDANSMPMFQRPSVEIVKCISFQKFRYSGENRPGKKYQEKEFMTLKLSNLQDKVVRVVIICTDADNRELIHPNGLVGKDCHDGIYDKEYAVTKQFFSIKIPYLRTERMKTKKDEHKKILDVLSTRASHLPSPYRERCLSQCTDKYTSRDKFDTTKVCLGVIVTVESHQGLLNGSLHAISHVIRNASEKTTLNILKLSNESIPALTGAYLDIFTTEEGPALEPDKYEVYVTCSSRSWQSKKFIPSKQDLLYKRVISYQVPRFEPDPMIMSPLPAAIHLECAQSNQYAQFPFDYIPQVSTDLMIVDEPEFMIGQKRVNNEADVKPPPKKLRSNCYEDGNTEVIKANLKTKLRARNETATIEAVSVDSQDSHDVEQQYIAGQKHSFPPDYPVLIYHEDPQTGEGSYLLDMDANKSQMNGGNKTTLAEAGLYSSSFTEKTSAGDGLHGSGAALKDSHSLANSQQQVQVPTSTVFLYNGAFMQAGRVVKDLIFQPGSQDQQLILSQTSNFLPADGPVIVEDSSSPIHKATSALISVRSTEPEERPSAYTIELTPSSVAQPVSEEGVLAVDNRQVPITARGLYATAGNISAASNSFVQADSFISSPSQFPSSAIPPLRRMLIPSKAVSSASPWEVEQDIDSESDYRNVLKSFEMSGKSSCHNVLVLKSEPADEDIFRQGNVIYTMASPVGSSYSVCPVLNVSEKGMLTRARSHAFVKDNTGRDCIPMATGADVSAAVPASSDSAGLSSMDVAEAIANNLPTMQIYEIAEDLENASNELEGAAHNS